MSSDGLPTRIFTDWPVLTSAFTATLRVALRMSCESTIIICTYGAKINK